ncbi:MAG: polysaccharide deacetylase family protein [Bacteroidales bacterium]|nr:polysaccharide deacetylase family protein [Bacteroidales bacterium]
MNKYYPIIFIAIILLGILIFTYKDKSIKYQPSDAQKKVNLEIGEGVIEINDLKYNQQKEIDFQDKKASANFDGQNVNYTILDILQPFNLDSQSDNEYPFLLKAEYPNNETVAYLVVARKQDDKFVSIDQIKIGNPDKIDEIHELNDNEVVVEAMIGEGDNKVRAHLSYTFKDDKIIPDAHNIDIDNSQPMTPIQTPAAPVSSSDDQTNSNDDDTNTSSGKVALTFDDGPGTFTPNVLNALQDKNTTATFFMIGENTQKHPDFVKQIHDAGHEIGNHTWDHPDLSKLSADSQKDEIQKANNAINSLVGITPHWLRPPYGNYDDNTESVLSSLGMQKVLWNVDTRDWSGLSADEIYQNAIDGLKDGAIILMHDGVNNSSETAKAVPRIIDTIREKGYDIVTISNL